MKQIQTTKPTEGPTFFGLGIAPRILEILEKLKFTNPTPIQYKAIPLAIEGKDVIGIAQTGTGKTLAFAIPIVQQLAQKDGIAIILAPTRELALQIEATFKTLTLTFGLRTVCLIGGAPMHPQEIGLRKQPRIIIATPGRFIDHMERRNIQMGKVAICVFDEADRMLDMGFAPQVEMILKSIPKDRQTMLFSATMPAEIVKMVQSHMKLPTHVEIAPPGTTAELVTQELYIVHRDEKIKLLGKVLDQYHGSVLLFIRTKHSARKLTKSIRDMGHRAVEIHSDRTLSQRREALEGFKLGRYRILVATDIAARGIDVSHIELVLNFDLPEDYDNYVHRIGRTGRAKAKGHAISFATPEQQDEVRNIEKLIRRQIPIATHPEVQPVQFQQSRGGSGRMPFRKKFGSKPFERRSYGEKQFGGKTFGEKRSFGERKPYGDSKPYGRKPFGNKSSDERTFTPRKSFGNKSFENKSSSERSYGEKSFGDRKPFREKPSFAKKSSEPFYARYKKRDAKSKF